MLYRFLRLAIVATALTGSRPMAVSPLSITAEVPSNTAFAMSDASARVGIGDWTIAASSASPLASRPAHRPRQP